MTRPLCVAAVQLRSGRDPSKNLPEVEALARRPALLVDGEMVSWYGSRAARGLRWLIALRRGSA